MSGQQLRVAVTARHNQLSRCGVAESPREVLERLWQDVAPHLSRLACALGLPADRVEDVLQDVYLTGLRKGPAGISRDELRRWLFRVTLNRCRLEQRQARRWQAVAKKLMFFRATFSNCRAAEAISHEEERRAISEALKTLDPELKTVLVLRYFSDLTSKEIGHILNLPDSTVRSHLRKARWQLATVLRRLGYDALDM